MDCNNIINTADLFSGIVGKDANNIPAIRYEVVTFAGSIDCNTSLSHKDLLNGAISFDPACGLSLRIAFGNADCAGDCINEFQNSEDILSSALVMATDGKPAIYLALKP